MSAAQSKSPLPTVVSASVPFYPRIVQVAHIEGVVRLPSRLAITTGSPPSIIATQELVVPRSIPIILPIVHLMTCLCVLDWLIIAGG